jgi:hypothetical protein
MNKVVQFLQEKNGDFSSTRLAFLLWIIGTLIAWVWVSVTQGTLQPIDETVVTIIGILMTGKVVQKFPEGNAQQSGASAPAAPATAPQVPATPTVGAGTP